MVSGSLTDSRDGQTYMTVSIGSQTRTAESLNYAYTGVPYNYDGYTSDSTSWCYDNAPANCAKYGRLYTWAAAMDSVGEWSTNGKGCGDGKKCSVASAGSATLVRGVCPKGWHLPSYDEWDALFTAVGGSSTAGTKLKSATGWAWDDDISGNGTDTFGFSALPAGIRNSSGYYGNEGYSALFWSSSEGSSNYASCMYLYSEIGSARLGNDSKNYGFSVRCLKD
ncbi:MAG: fibrobacter succinogenes major paralogous domain-containing protein [Fibrobacter sp.]|nr:fibrobacter succinogenes major paralogous domain-containing protein [Fibrobacter sp.]